MASPHAGWGRDRDGGRQGLAASCSAAPCCRERKLLPDPALTCNLPPQLLPTRGMLGVGSRATMLGAAPRLPLKRVPYRTEQKTR
uniref:Uncharacterized protein n=1 Tax=Pavo cristatus TaxID=9049 RepID=A0A8C9L6C3_PAVCR